MQIIDANHAKVAFDIAKSEGTGPHLSLYIPVRRSLRQPKVEFERLIKQATKLLSEALSPSEVEAFLAPMTKHFASEGIREKGIALFRSPKSFYFTQLSITPDPLYVVADSFHIKPLLQCISTRTVSFAVTVSPRALKVYRVEGADVSLIKTYAHESMPATEERRLLVGQPKRQKESTERFLRDTVKKIVKEHHILHYPLSLFGPRVIRRRFLAELRSRSSPDVLFESTMFSSLTEMAKKIRQAHTAKAHRDSQRFVKEMLHTAQPSLISNTLEEIAQAAVEGRIAKLVVDPSVHLWGVYDRDQGLVKVHQAQSSAKDDCVIDDIIEEVLKRAGEVVFFDATRLEKVPPYMALLRW